MHTSKHLCRQHMCLCKTLYQYCPHGEISYSDFVYQNWYSTTKVMLVLSRQKLIYRNLKSCFYLFQYLTKQTSTLREVNDSRVKIYEQLEVSISDLETTNNKLMEENLNDKVKIKRYVLIHILFCFCGFANRVAKLL